MLTPEQKVRKECITYLRAKGHLVLPHTTTASYLPSKGIYASFNTNYGTKGESDILVFHKQCPAFPIWIELKKKGKRKIDPDQVLFKKQVQEWGHEYLVVNCQKDLILHGF